MRATVMYNACDVRTDAAYRTKYHRSAAYVPPMVSPGACAATLRLVPR